MGVHLFQRLEENFVGTILISMPKLDFFHMKEKISSPLCLPWITLLPLYLLPQLENLKPGFLRCCLGDSSKHHLLCLSHTLLTFCFRFCHFLGHIFVSKQGQSSRFLAGQQSSYHQIKFVLGFPFSSCSKQYEKLEVFPGKKRKRKLKKKKQTQKTNPPPPKKPNQNKKNQEEKMKAFQHQNTLISFLLKKKKN